MPRRPLATAGNLIEGSWAAAASSYYGHGNCIKIHYWLDPDEVEYGSDGCY